MMHTQFFIVPSFFFPQSILIIRNQELVLRNLSCDTSKFDCPVLHVLKERERERFSVEALYCSVSCMFYEGRGGKPLRIVQYGIKKKIKMFPKTWIGQSPPKHVINSGAESWQEAGEIEVVLILHYLTSAVCLNYRFPCF